MENEYSKTERIEDAQLDSALAFHSWKEKNKEKAMKVFKGVA